MFAFAPFVGALFAFLLSDRSGSASMLAGAVLNDASDHEHATTTTTGITPACGGGG